MHVEPSTRGASPAAADHRVACVRFGLRLPSAAARRAREHTMHLKTRATIMSSDCVDLPASAFIVAVSPTTCDLQAGRVTGAVTVSIGATAASAYHQHVQLGLLLSVSGIPAGGGEPIVLFESTRPVTALAPTSTKASGRDTLSFKANATDDEAASRHTAPEDTVMGTASDGEAVSIRLCATPELTGDEHPGGPPATVGKRVRDVATADPVLLQDGSRERKVARRDPQAATLDSVLHLRADSATVPAAASPVVLDRLPLEQYRSGTAPRKSSRQHAHAAEDISNAMLLASLSHAQAAPQAAPVAVASEKDMLAQARSVTDMAGALDLLPAAARARIVSSLFTRMVSALNILGDPAVQAEVRSTFGGEPAFLATVAPVSAPQHVWGSAPQMQSAPNLVQAYASLMANMLASQGAGSAHASLPAFPPPTRHATTGFPQPHPLYTSVPTVYTTASTHITPAAVPQ